MDSKNLYSGLELLDSKIKLLVNSYEAIRLEVNKLREENKRLQGIVDNKESEINDFQNRDKISKIVEGIGEEREDTTELKSMITDYVKEIDKCIAHLSE